MIPHKTSFGINLGDKLKVDDNLKQKIIDENIPIEKMV